MKTAVKMLTAWLRSLRDIMKYHEIIINIWQHCIGYIKLHNYITEFENDRFFNDFQGTLEDGLAVGAEALWTARSRH